MILNPTQIQSGLNMNNVLQKQYEATDSLVKRNFTPLAVAYQGANFLIQYFYNDRIEIAASSIYEQNFKALLLRDAKLKYGIYINDYTEGPVIEKNSVLSIGLYPGNPSYIKKWKVYANNVQLFEISPVKSGNYYYLYLKFDEIA